MSEMRVTKRDGTLTIVEFDKILRRIRILGAEANLKINYTSLAMKVIDQLYDGISTTKIDELSAEQCASLSSSNLDYNVLAGRIVVSNHQKNTNPSFTYVMHSLYNFIDKHEKRSPLVSEDLYQLTLTNGAELDAICDYSRDYAIDYFGFKTLERAYLMKIHGKSVERPQHMWLRVAIGIHGTNMERIRETYKYMSLKYFTHATPTLFNAGTPHPQLSSCFLEAMESDSVDGIYNTLKDCAQISKWAGGIGLHIHNVRASGSHIRGTNGRSNGIVPMLKVFNNTAKYIDQCVHPETIIYTTQGPKQIQYCTVGETAIYNSKGETEVIQDLLEHSYEGEFLEIDTGCNLLRITPMHPVCTMRKNSESVEWVDADDLIVGDRLVFAVPKWSADIIEITAEDCYMYGYLHKFASFTIDSMTGFVAVDKAKRASIGQYFTDRLVKFDTTREDENTSVIKWKFAVHLPFRCRSDFTDETGHKHLHHRWLNLPVEKSKHILRGLLEDDINQYSTRQIQKRETSSTIDLMVSESGFAESVRFLCLKMGFIANISAENDTWIVKIAKNPEICKILFAGTDAGIDKGTGNSILLTEIKSINSTAYSGILYDLQMKDQHDYLIHNGLVHNGGGRRNGSFAIYLEPWHADVELFLQMRKNHGDEELKARDLFYAMWIPDLFMERVKANGKWTLMCPDECPGLADVYGDKFVALYTKYEEAGKGRVTVNARDIWFQILDAQMETGTPYILFKDACNEKSNQKNLGTIKSSNLCVAPETLILTDKGHMTIQNLEGQMVNVWNGEEFSEVVVTKTGTNQELIDVLLDDGSKLTCTPQHKFYIMKDTIEQMVTAEELMPGDELLQCSSYPVIDGMDTCNSDQMPSYNCSIKTKLDWLTKHIGNVLKHDLKISSTDTVLLQKLKLFLQTCGISSSIETKFLHIESGTQPLKILAVENNGRTDDTYCFTEPKRHMGVFNGILTGQCTEIIQYSDEHETAVCNLASIALPTFVSEDGVFDYEELHKVAKIVIYNLNRVIDVNYYPIPKTRTSNLRHRPVGLGIQGLSCCFAIMNIPYHSESAKEINKKIFETLYHASLEQSCDLAIIDGPYETFAGSPASKGILQFDMWKVAPGNSRYDWDAMKERIKKHGLRNSLLLAPMPTASTSQILGFNECIEPYTSNIYNRRTMAGEFIMTNKYLMKDLTALGLWNDKLKNNIIANNGSVQQIESIPKEIRDKYKTVWELPMKHLIDMSADRGAFICQSQSLNLWLEDPNYNTLTSMHFYSWSKGLKTGIYYLRRRARHQAQKFTIEPEKKQHTTDEENHECEMCGA